MPYKVVGRLRWLGKDLPRGTVLEDSAIPKAKAKAFVMSGRIVPFREEAQSGPSVSNVIALTEMTAAELIDGLRSGELSPDEVEVVELARGDRKVRSTVLAAIKDARTSDEDGEASDEDE